MGEWRKHGKHEWRYTHADAGGEWVEYTAHLGWDGCLNLYNYTNGAHPDMTPDEVGDDCDYMHICHIDEFIGVLEAFKAANEGAKA